MSGTRRKFLKQTILGLGGLATGALAAGCPRQSTASTGATATGALNSASAQVNIAEASGVLTQVTGKSPYDATVLAVRQLGGMSRFVKKGQTVALIPNIGWARTMEQGANTHPEVVRALIEMCYAEQAKSVTVFCNPCNGMKSCLEESGIGAVIDASRATFEFINDRGWRARSKVKGVSFLDGCEVYRVFDDCDVIINAPVAKHHGSSQLTLCCKNLMGAVRDRRKCHQNLHEAIADLTLMIPHHLCVLDASRILTNHGPQGGDLKDVTWKNTIIAGINPVEVDVLGTLLFDKQPHEIGYLNFLGERGYAPIDPAKLKYTTASA